eukprot:CAMPEP_0118847464 /NCGR_PEP_ID=MMETSP1162-20130426/92979_1 /TAXON_ID=33656 /ORGANISM="Phaeocystis Sp, Strain CCMP2710" /LENGTH=252 /DNA_ID=CAMNT_0006779655 /DNA_START=59 /DNA_END=814 /DNA_ORIENTATION=-
MTDSGPRPRDSPRVYIRPHPSPAHMTLTTSTYLLSVRAEVTVAEVAKPGHYVLALVEDRVDGARDHADRGVRLVQRLQPHAAAHDVHEDDVLLPSALLEQHAHGGDGAASRGEHRIEEKERPAVEPQGQLGVEQRGQGRRLVALYQHLAHCNGRQHVAAHTEHAVRRAHDGHRHEARLLGQAHAFVAAARRRDGHRSDRQQAERLLEQHLHEAVGASDEGAPARVLVADGRVQSAHERRLAQHRRRRRHCRH